MIVPLFSIGAGLLTDFLVINTNARSSEVALYSDVTKQTSFSFQQNSIR
jgi:hypothetical protein